MLAKNKLKVWKKGVEKQEDVIFVRLIEGVNGHIDLVGCDEDGVTIENGGILVIHQGIHSIILSDNLSSEIPLKTGALNTVLAYPEWEARAMKKYIDTFHQEHADESKEITSLKQLLESLKKIRDTMK